MPVIASHGCIEAERSSQSIEKDNLLVRVIRSGVDTSSKAIFGADPDGGLLARFTPARRHISASVDPTAEPTDFPAVVRDALQRTLITMDTARKLPCPLRRNLARRCSSYRWSGRRLAVILRWSRAESRR